MEEELEVAVSEEAEVGDMMGDMMGMRVLSIV